MLEAVLVQFFLIEYIVFSEPSAQKSRYDYSIFSAALDWLPHIISPGSSSISLKIIFYLALPFFEI